MDRPVPVRNRPRRRPLVALAGLALWAPACAGPPAPWSVTGLARAPALHNPGDLVRFQGRFVATEIFDQRLAIFDDLALGGLRHFDPEAIGERLESPQFLAVSPRGTLLISEGWGDRIVEIADLEGGGWRAFAGVGTPFRAPHGICVDRQGWIYVADSMNSRIVRFRNLEGSGWQVFADRGRRVAFVRELVCRDGRVWAANNYEDRPGLNPGSGANILRIDDFASGEAAVVWADAGEGVTGMAVVGRSILIGLWHAMSVLQLDLDGEVLGEVAGSRAAIGVPYGMLADDGGAVIATYFGEMADEGRRNRGGLARLAPAARGAQRR